MKKFLNGFGEILAVVGGALPFMTNKASAEQEQVAKTPQRKSKEVILQVEPLAVADSAEIEDDATSSMDRAMEAAIAKHATAAKVPQDPRVTMASRSRRTYASGGFGRRGAMED